LRSPTRGLWEVLLTVHWDHDQEQTAGQIHPSALWTVQISRKDVIAWNYHHHIVSMIYI